jgi:hypothetical protein
MDRRRLTPQAKSHAHVAKVHSWSCIQIKIMFINNLYLRVHAPKVHPPQPRGAVIAGWNEIRRPLFCEERLEAAPAGTMSATRKTDPRPILIGPGGGFAPEGPVSLGDGR